MSDIAINQVLAQMRTMQAMAAPQSTEKLAETPGNFSNLMQDSIREVNEPCKNPER
jgi:flagellar hook-basal body complex protein FliE